MDLVISSKKQGAELTSICFQGKERLFQGKNFWNRQAPVLFPIVGKLKDNQTQIEGKNYNMTQHGFARDSDFEVIEKTQTKHQYRLRSNQETLKQYPYLFELKITYTVFENTLMIDYEVKNLDTKKIYFGIGGYPAFICDYSSGDYEIIFSEKEEEVEFLKLKEGLIDTEKGKNVIQNETILLHGDIFEQDAIIMKNLKSKQVILQNHKTKQKELTFNFKGFPYLAIWSKKGAPFVCIEPWQSTADKIDSDGIYQNKEDILSLAPKEKFHCQYKIKFY